MILFTVLNSLLFFIEYLFDKSDNEIVNSIRSLNTPSVSK